MQITLTYKKLVSMQDYKLRHAGKTGTVVRQRYSLLGKYNPNGATYSISEVGMDIIYPN